jgi:hypothetical protein
MSKFNDLRSQNPSWDVNIFDLLKKADPSDTNRYVGFILKCIKINCANPNEILDKMVGGNLSKLQKFHAWHEEGLIEKKDILQYRDWDEFETQYKKAEEKEKMREAEKQVTKIHEDEEWLLLLPKSYEAAKLYGNATKWCITQTSHWNNYKERYYYIYIINKKTNKKFCINKDVRSSKYQAWDAEDKQIDVLDISIPPELYSHIFKELKENNCPVGVDVDDFKLWKTADGVVIKIDDMNTVHLKNTIRLFRTTTDFLTKSKIQYMEKVLEEKTALEESIIKKRKSTKNLSEALAMVKSQKRGLDDLIDDYLGNLDTSAFPF